MPFFELSKKELKCKLEKSEANRLQFLKRCYDSLGLSAGYYFPYEDTVIREIADINAQLAKHKKPKGAWKERIEELERKLELKNEYIKGMKDAK